MTDTTVKYRTFPISDGELPGCLFWAQEYVAGDEASKAAAWQKLRADIHTVTEEHVRHTEHPDSHGFQYLHCFVIPMDTLPAEQS
jgi:hypothetical protein